MDNLKIYQICHHLITYFTTLISPKKSQLGPIFRTRGSIKLEKKLSLNIQPPLLLTHEIWKLDFYIGVHEI